MNQMHLIQGQNSSEHRHARTILRLYFEAFLEQKLQNSVKREQHVFGLDQEKEPYGMQALIKSAHTQPSPRSRMPLCTTHARSHFSTPCV